jgi:hypothetical protein
MLVLFECLVNVPRHGAVDMASFVVPGEFYTTEEQSCPVNGNLVVFLESRLEVLGVSYALYFYAKVVNDKAKDDSPLHVMPQSRCVLALIYPLAESHCFNSLFTRMPAWGRPYIPFLILV